MNFRIGDSFRSKNIANKFHSGIRFNAIEENGVYAAMHNRAILCDFVLKQKTYNSLKKIFFYFHKSAHYADNIGA